MLKTASIKRIIIASFALIIFLIIYAIPKKTNNIQENKVEEQLSIYTLGKSGYVERNTVSSKEKDKINCIISILTKNSLYQNILPNNLFPIIPKNTKLLSYEINDEIVSLNFSEEFLNIEKASEIKLIESLIFSLCELKNINGIKILVNNMPLEKLPKTNIKLPSILNKSFGINKYVNIKDIKNTNQVVVYYKNKQNDNYIPITYIANSNTNKIEIIINELKSSSIINPNISSILNASYELKDYEILENEINVSFSSKLLNTINSKDIEEEVKYILALSIRDTLNMDDITINIE